MKNIAAATSIPNIVECKKGFQQYSERIDKINSMLDRINNDLTSLEHNVTKAEDELGYNNTGIKGFFKSIEKAVKNDRVRAETSDDAEPPIYQPINVFKSSDYFDRSKETEQDEEHS